MNHSITIIASFSRPELNLWVNGSVATMIAGSLFFFFGAIIGWWMWKNARAQSQELALVNKELVRDYKNRNRDFKQLTDELAPYTNRVEKLNLK